MFFMIYPVYVPQNITASTADAARHCFVGTFSLQRRDHGYVCAFYAPPSLLIPYNSISLGMVFLRTVYTYINDQANVL